jgi:hypothetical protein
MQPMESSYDTLVGGPDNPKHSACSGNEARSCRFGPALTGPRHELPGMWFNADEIHALLTIQQNCYRNCNPAC